MSRKTCPWIRLRKFKNQGDRSLALVESWKDEASDRRWTQGEIL